MTATATPSLRHRLEYQAFRIGRMVLASVPERVGAVVGAGLGWVFGSLLRVRRRETEGHLGVAFPTTSHRWRARTARACYAHLGREVDAWVRMDRWSTSEIADRVDFVGFEPVVGAVERGEGAILLTAHLGNWEMAGAAIASLGIPLGVVGKGLANRRVEHELFASRERTGLRMIEIREAPRDVPRALSAGRVVALLWDQNAHRGGIFVPFFGTSASTHRGPALFALRADVPVFVGFALRRQGARHRYTLEAHRLDVERSGDEEVDAGRLVARYHGVLEAAIRAAPEQYFWPHRRWKTRPPSED